MTVLLTHACQYAGPGIVPVLLRDRRELYCHDARFVDPDVARTFETQHRGAGSGRPRRSGNSSAFSRPGVPRSSPAR
jgi:hypothetical protein